MSSLDRMLKQAKRSVERMTLKERAAMLEKQRESFVRAMTTRCEHGELDFEQCQDCRGSDIGIPTSIDRRNK